MCMKRERRLVYREGEKNETNKREEKKRLHSTESGSDGESTSLGAGNATHPSYSPQNAQKKITILLIPNLIIFSIFMA